MSERSATHPAPAARSLNEHYDVIVVGMQCAGILAAALMAKRGRRVLLADHGEGASTYAHGRFLLPLASQLLVPLDNAPHAVRVHDELGLSAAMRNLWAPERAGVQAILARARIDIRQPMAALCTELVRELGEAQAPLEAFLARLFELDAALTKFLAKMPPLPPCGAWERFRVWRASAMARGFASPFDEGPLLAGLSPDHPLRTLARAPLHFLGQLWGQRPATFVAVRLLCRFLRGLAAPAPGAQPSALFLEAAQRIGVSVRRGAVVEQVGAARRRLTQVRLAGARDTQSASFFVDNTLAPFAELLAPSARHPKLTAAAQAAVPVGALFMLNLVVAADVIPQGMARAVFLLEGPGSGGGPDAPLLLQRASAGPDATHEVLSIACPVRVAHLRHAPERVQAIERQIVGRVRRLVPFLDGALRASSVALDRASWHGQPPTEHHDRCVAPWQYHALYAAARPSTLGILARPIQTYYKNLLHCGRDVLPGLGAEGDYITAMAVAARLEKMAARTWHG